MGGKERIINSPQRAEEILATPEPDEAAELLGELGVADMNAVDFLGAVQAIASSTKKELQGFLGDSYQIHHPFGDETSHYDEAQELRESLPATKLPKISAHLVRECDLLGRYANEIYYHRRLLQLVMFLVERERKRRLADAQQKVRDEKSVVGQVKRAFEGVVRSRNVMRPAAMPVEDESGAGYEKLKLVDGDAGKQDASESDAGASEGEGTYSPSSDEEEDSGNSSDTINTVNIEGESNQTADNSGSECTRSPRDGALYHKGETVACKVCGAVVSGGSSGYSLHLTRDGHVRRDKSKPDRIAARMAKMITKWKGAQGETMRVWQQVGVLPMQVEMQLKHTPSVDFYFWRENLFVNVQGCFHGTSPSQKMRDRELRNWMAKHKFAYAEVFLTGNHHYANMREIQDKVNLLCDYVKGGKFEPYKIIK